MHRKRDRKTSRIFSMKWEGWHLWAILFENENWTGHGATALLCPITKIPVPELVLLWPSEKHCPSLRMLTSFSISRNPSCEADTGDAMWVTRSQDEKIFSSQRFMFISSCHHILIKLLSLNNLSLWLPQNWGVLVSGLCSAAQSRSSLCIAIEYVTELQFLIEVTGISNLFVRRTWAQVQPLVSEKGM